MAEKVPDSPELRAELNKLWQKVCVDTIARGMDAGAVFETMMIVGAAGVVEVHGKLAAAKRLSAIAQQLLGQVQQEADALRESETAVKN